MNTLDILIHALGWTLIHSLWLGALIGAVYALAAHRWRQQQPQRAYGVGLAGLLVLAAGLVALFWRQWALVSNAAFDHAIAQATAMLPVPGAMNSTAVLSYAPAGEWAAWIDAALPWLVLAWAIAVTALATGVARAHWALRRLVLAGVPLVELAAPVWQLAQQFGVRQSIAVVSSACARVPFVIGHFAPVIVLPVTIATGMPWPQLRLILAHEIAHLRRADYLWNWLQLALEVLLFFHPVVRWLSVDLRRLREACCDDLVLRTAGGRTDYARALLSLEEFRNEVSRLAPSAAAGALLWRVQRIAGRNPPTRALAQRILVPVAGFALALGMLGSGLDNPRFTPSAGADAVPRASLVQTLPAQTLAAVAVAGWRLQALLAPAVPAVAPIDPQSLPQPTLALAVRPDVTAPLPLAVDMRAPLAPEALRITPRVEIAPELDAVDPYAPLFQRAPAYPESERLRGRRVTIEISYLLDSDGRVVNMRAESPPARASAFVAEAKQALADWRFSRDAAAHHAGQRLSQRFAFHVGESDGADRCVFMTGTRICRK